MNILILTRKVHNSKGVFGELEIRRGREMYVTVERPQVPDKWEKMTATQRMRYCIPVGQYKVRYRYDANLNSAFEIRGISTWQFMQFSGSNQSQPNTIRVGVEATGDGNVKRGDEVMEALSGWIEELMNMGFIPTKPQYGFFQLVVKNAPDYHEGEYLTECDEESDLDSTP